MTDPTIPPAQPTPPAYAATGTPATFPGKTLGIVAIPVAIFFSVVGIILGFVARSQSKGAGIKNTPATIAIIVGFIVLVLTIIGLVVGIVLAAALLSSTCAGLEPGVYTTDTGVTVACP
ncbi:hypothetical protein GCM10007382_24930 [Salinibacterium xinjiangense]|uniref:DUF4190 domain-containing protein n=1 Tax=Salinibacterium xinjiangense TaxID=386302 RepID=A0A2C9A1B8_9MICO|nr:DUF4190 domain-containing protein [Salinibacterium xinjiangense]GGL04078.1 hypothetical protein GCM10007382_24930 [Salinibacterium xinjiangense]SOE72647.1 hypothetical protein SAMN06296378_2569 [Salinibacterium xinjiangense]